MVLYPLYITTRHHHHHAPPPPPSSPCTTTIVTMHHHHHHAPPSPCTTITMHHHHRHHAPPPSSSSSSSLPSLIPSGFQVYVLLHLHPIDLSGKGLSLLPTSVLPGKGFSLSPPQNPKAILIENRDVYMINPCSANISFVVELCETVSV